jgi:hypothetical protein
MSVNYYIYFKVQVKKYESHEQVDVTLIPFAAYLFIKALENSVRPFMARKSGTLPNKRSMDIFGSILS